jgi:tetratricopeptide (TPR) repeat protein
MDRLDQIKHVGDSDPATALAMLDSLEIEMRAESEYTRNKYDLLRIRLNDKADKTATSDIVIKSLLGYFEREGTVQDKQEVCYYAGSVYRDLQDTPRALEYFFRSIEYAEDAEDCDSVMLQNTYSNLNYLYYGVQNYQEAVATGRKELEVCRALGRDKVVPLLHLGGALMATDSTRQAKAYLDEALQAIESSNKIAHQQGNLHNLLCHYVELGERQNAERCRKLIDGDPIRVFAAFPCIALAMYYQMTGRTDSASVFLNRVIDDGTDINNMYDAAKMLYQMYDAQGNQPKALHYARIYMQLSDSLDFGKRQQLAATVGNEYQYHLDQKKEQQLRDAKEHYKLAVAVVCAVALLLLCLGYAVYVRRRNRHLEQITALSQELQGKADDEQRLRQEIDLRERKLSEAKYQLEKQDDELGKVKAQLDKVSTELTGYDIELREKEQRLTEKMQQNQTFLNLLHQSELEGKAEDVIEAIRQSSEGKKNMQPADWKQLYRAVDELYPTFQDQLLKELGTFTEQQMQVCYLMRIGLSKPQIQNMTNLSRVTVWRWVKKFDWVQGEKE